jgi:tRNA G10  N-methylase Trm11
MSIIKSISFDQDEVIKNIIQLHCPNGIDVDPTYSKGNFYKNIKEPRMKFDLFPKTSDTIKSDSRNLPIDDQSINSIMFDPPFIVGHTKEKPTGIIGERFHGFRYIKDLWDYYDESLSEFYRITKLGGVLIFKCQDTVSGGKQHLSHVHIINQAEKIGYYTSDLFVLLAKNRIIGHNHKMQKHARKYHSYFLVFKKVERLNGKK